LLRHCIHATGYVSPDFACKCGSKGSIRLIGWDGGTRSIKISVPFKREQCYDCHFYRGNSKEGYCHRRAPVISPSVSIALFPAVKSEDWCGEYERKTDANDHSQRADSEPVGSTA
jgi:hypothetical protein